MTDRQEEQDDRDRPDHDAHVIEQRSAAEVRQVEFELPADVVKARAVAEPDLRDTRASIAHRSACTSRT